MAEKTTMEIKAQEETFLIQTGDATRSLVGFGDGGLKSITAEDFDKVAHLVEQAGTSFVQRVRQMAGHPTICELEFGVSVGAEGGVPFFTKGSLEANFKVTVKWDTGE